MARWQLLLGLFSLLLILCNGLPVVPKEEVEEETDPLLDEEDTGLEYDKYLRQVIKVLEKDPDMRKRMEELSLEDLKEGNFARELGFLSANIRTKLDELKRIEVQRLRTVARQRMEAAAGKAGANRMDPKALENMVGHVDPATMDKFTDADFERLIKKAAADLDEADKERRKEFKRYEMEKELQRRQTLKQLDEDKRREVEEEFQKRKDKIKNHPKLKHPGSKAQMQEVWEETDHLDPDDFNPKTFFALHDTNGDRKLDMFELEALFIKEVEKIYKDTDADPREKFEEMSRMREHVLREIDLDGDKMVSRDEFLKAADQAQFENDEGWKDINQEDQFTEDELQEYNRMVQERLERKKIKMQQEHERYLQDNKVDQQQPNIQMNQQQVNLNQQQQQGQDPKLRINQPPVNINPNQVPNVNQGQVPAQQAGQPIQQGQPPVNQAAAGQPPQGQVPPQQAGQPVQQGKPPGPPQGVQQQNQQQQQQQQLNQQQQINLQQQQIKQQQLNQQQQQGQPPAQPAQEKLTQHQLNLKLQQEIRQRQLNQQQQGDQPPVQPVQGGAQGQPPVQPAQGGAQGQPPVQAKPVVQPVQGQPPVQPVQAKQPVQPIQPVQNKPVVQPVQGQPPVQPVQAKQPVQPVQPVQNKPAVQPVQGQPPVQGKPPVQPVQAKPAVQPVQGQPPVQGGAPAQPPIQPAQGQPPAQPPQGGAQGQPPPPPQGGVQGQPPQPQGGQPAQGVNQGQPPVQQGGQGGNPPV